MEEGSNKERRGRKGGREGEGREVGRDQGMGFGGEMGEGGWDGRTDGCVFMTPLHHPLLLIPRLLVSSSRRNDSGRTHKIFPVHRDRGQGIGVCDTCSVCRRHKYKC